MGNKGGKSGSTELTQKRAYFVSLTISTYHTGNFF